LPGVEPDGQQCFEDTVVDLLTQSKQMQMVVRKPSNQTSSVQFVIRASGEDAFNASYGITMERRSIAHPGLNASRNEWSDAAQLRVSLDGHHLIWTSLPPSADSEFPLSKGAARFSAFKNFAFQIELNCTAGQRCVEDGDTITTVLRTGLPSSADGMRSMVQITTAVQSVVSCDRSEAWVQGKRRSERLEGSTVSRTFPIIVRVAAMDVDHLPIMQNQALLRFEWDGASFAWTWSGHGTNEYTAELPSDLMAQPGDHTLVVSVQEGFSRKAGHGACVLLKTTITVDSDKTQIYVAAGISSLMALTLGVLGWLLYKHRQRSRQLLMSFMHFEGVLVRSSHTSVAVRRMRLF
jgi:hypothetical protein